VTPSDGSARSVDPELLLSDQRWLVALARSLVGDADAEDVVQEARLLAWLHAPTDPARAGGWLRRITRNVALHVRRREARRAAREPAGASPESQPPTDELVARVQMQRAVADAVLALAEPYRSAVLLRFFDRLPPREIAARLDLPVETVRTRLKRALEQLRARLDREYGARDAWAALLLPWTMVATTTTKVGVKVVVAALLIGSAGVATWEGVRRASMRASEGGAQVEAASAAGRSAVARDGDSRANDRPDAGADRAARSEDSSPGGRPRTLGFDHVRLAARVVDESTHTPIAGARMAVTYRIARGRSVAAGVTSDADGRIVLDFGPTETDNVDFVLSHSDHARLEKHETLEATASPEPRERRAEHDFGELALERGSVLSGRVVRMPDRSPVADAKLFVLRSGFGSFFWISEAEPQGSTGPNGSFELPERFAARIESPIVYAVAPCGVGWISPPIVKGRDRIADLEIEVEVPARLDVLVVDESDRPLSGASVFALPRFPPLGPSSYRAYRSEAPRLQAGEWSELFSATTGPDGRASLINLPEGRSDELLHRGGGNPRTYTIFARALTGRRRTAVANLRLEHGQRTEVKLVARPLVPRTIRGRVSDDRGQPIADARIELEGDSSATTDEAGLYELPSFIADRDWLGFKIAAEGLGSIEQEFLDSELGDRIVPIRGEDGALAREELVIDFTLPSLLAVKGRCIDASGNGVANVHVEFQQRDSRSSDSIRRMGGTDENGRFRIEGVMPGIGSLSVSPPRGFRSVASRFMNAGVPDVEVRLVTETPARARVIADVVEADTRQPADVAQAFLYPMDYGNSCPACSCAVGTAKAEGLHLGRWSISIGTLNGSRVHREFEVIDPDEEVRLHLETAPCASIDGHLARSDGQPIPPDRRPMVFVRAGTNFSDDGGHSVDLDGRTCTDVYGPCARVDADGSFRIEGITPRTPIRLYSREPESIGEAVVVLEPGEKRRIEIVTSPGAELSFRIAERMAAGRFRLEVAREDGRFGLLTQDDAVRDGEIWMKEFFAPGHLRWRVTHVSEEEEVPAPRTVEGDLEVVAGRPQVVDIRGLK